jgi:hypothetical protein
MYSDHLERKHARLNAHVRNLQTVRVGFAEIASVITMNAATLSEKVKRGWRATKKKLQDRARERDLNYKNCAENGHLDTGVLLIRRLERQLPCFQTISQGGWPRERPHPQFNVSATGARDIAFTVFDRDWTMEAGNRRSKLGQLKNETEGTLLAADGPPDAREVLRIRQEIMLLNPGIKLKDSRDETLFRLGPIQGQHEATLGPSLTEREIKLRANSRFLLVCVQEAKAREQRPSR